MWKGNLLLERGKLGWSKLNTSKVEGGTLRVTEVTCNIGKKDKKRRKERWGVVKYRKWKSKKEKKRKRHIVNKGIVVV